MKQMKKLIDVFPSWYDGGGIFSVLQEFGVPWQDEDFAQSLDNYYYGNQSGDKYVSPLVSKLMAGETLTTEEKTVIATTILAVNGVNWGKLWSTLEFEYDPIENYHMVENMTDDETVTEYGKTHTRTDNLTHGKTGTETDTPNITETRTDNLTHGKTGTETDTPNITETRTDNLSHRKTGTETDEPDITEVTTPNLESHNANDVYGFNSADGTPSNELTQTSTGTNTVRRTGTDEKTFNLTENDTGTQATQKTGTEQHTYNTQETDTGTQATQTTGTEQHTYNTQETDTGTVGDVDSGSDTQTRNYQLTRSGNIGVTTSQQMIQSERDLWIWNFFLNVVFPDLDKVLTLRIY